MFVKRASLFYGTERNGTESVVALSSGTERNTANMANMQVEFDAATFRNLFFKVEVNLISRGNSD